VGSGAQCTLESIFNFGTIYIVCIVCFVSFFLLHFFLTYLLPYLSFPLRIDPLLFQAWCRKRWLNLAFFCVCFVLQYISCDWWMRTFVMLGLGFSQTKPGDWLGETSPKWLFCVEWGIKPQLSQCELIEMLFGMWTQMDPRSLVLSGGQVSSGEGAILRASSGPLWCIGHIWHEPKLLVKWWQRCSLSVSVLQQLVSNEGNSFIHCKFI